MHFRFRHVGSSAHKRSYGFYALEYSPLGDAWSHLVFHEDWGFYSCAVACWSGFNHGDWNYTFWKNTENIDKLIAWLQSNTVLGSTYNPKEFMFVLGNTQHSGHELKKLITHPNVREIDVFANKAHDGWPVKVYRLSVEKDFKK